MDWFAVLSEFLKLLFPRCTWVVLSPRFRNVPIWASSQIPVGRPNVQSMGTVSGTSSRQMCVTVFTVQVLVSNQCSVTGISTTMDRSTLLSSTTVRFSWCLVASPWSLICRVSRPRSGITTPCAMTSKADLVNTQTWSTWRILCELCAALSLILSGRPCDKAFKLKFYYFAT